MHEVVEVLQRMRDLALSLGKDTWLTSWELIKITVPIMILTRILEEMGLIVVISRWLEPVMGLIGLPGELGLVWATAMLTTLYGGMAVFAALAPGLELTVAHVTVLCAAMLFAHSLPIELSISKKTGVPVTPIATLRLGGAVLYCFILSRLCDSFGLWQQPAPIIFAEVGEHLSHFSWALKQCRNIGLIIVVIFCVLLFMRLLKVLGVLDLLERILAPVLPHFGMGRQAAPITVVGMVLGIGYGGALIIREVAAGKMAREEIFNSMAMMALCHGLVEDTLLMFALGGKLGGILWGRIIFALVVIFILVRVRGVFTGSRKCLTT